MVDILLGKIWQAAYVVSDTDAAIASLDARLGIGKFLRSGVVSLAPADAPALQIELALAFVGDTQIELIRPAGGADAVYRTHLPERPGELRFHHHAYRLMDEAGWASMRADVDRLGYRVVMQGEASNTRYLYIDATAELGHFIEYLFYIDPPNSSLPRIPQNRP